MPTASNVLIVGGGISGMTLALGLKKAGICCEIVEINSQWTVLGVGIALQGPALRALRTIGLLNECVERGFGYSHFTICDADGRVTGRVELPRLNGPDYPATIGIMRQAVHSVLKDAVTRAGVSVCLGVTVASLEQNDDFATVQFTDGTHANYALVVGADGTNSNVRDLVFGTECKPKYTGQAVWRATVSRPKEVRGRYSFFGPRNKAGFNPVSKTEMYVFLVQNLPKFIRLPDDQLPEVIQEQLNDFGGLVAAVREEITDPNHIVYRPVTSHILSPPWHRGRVVLIGDAAHTSTPQMATGAGLAVEDSIVLASLLQSEEDLSRALDNFMTRRFERCQMVVKNSFQLGEWEKDPSARDADPVGLTEKSVKALAQPI